MVCRVHGKIAVKEHRYNNVSTTGRQAYTYYGGKGNYAKIKLQTQQ